MALHWNTIVAKANAKASKKDVKPVAVKSVKGKSKNKK